MQVAGNLLGPGHPHKCTSDVTRLFLSSFYLLFFKACFQYVEDSFEEYVFVLKCVCMCASLSACAKVIDIELTVKISRVQSKTV